MSHLRTSTYTKNEKALGYQLRKLAEAENKTLEDTVSEELSRFMKEEFNRTIGRLDFTHGQLYKLDELSNAELGNFFMMWVGGLVENDPTED